MVGSAAFAAPVRAEMGAPNVHAEDSTRRGARRVLQAPHRKQMSCTLPAYWVLTRQWACQTSSGMATGAMAAGGKTGAAVGAGEAAHPRHAASAITLAQYAATVAGLARPAPHATTGIGQAWRDAVACWLELTVR